jgi:hypothetical protein
MTILICLHIHEGHAHETRGRRGEEGIVDNSGKRIQSAPTFVGTSRRKPRRLLSLRQQNRIELQNKTSRKDVYRKGGNGRVVSSSLRSFVRESCDIARASVKAPLIKLIGHGIQGLAARQA